MLVWRPPTERRKCFKVTHSGLFLFECTYRKSLCLSVTHRKLFWFQVYQHTILKVTGLPVETCFCFNVTQKYPQKSEKGLGLPIYEIKPLFFVYMYTYMFIYIIMIFLLFLLLCVFYKILLCVFNRFYWFMFTVYVCVCRHKYIFCFAFTCLRVWFLFGLNSVGVNIHTWARV